MTSTTIHQQLQRLSLIVVVSIFATLLVDIHVVSAFSTVSTSSSYSSAATTRISPSSSSSSAASVLSMASSMAARPSTSSSAPRTMLPEGLVKTIVNRGQTNSVPIRRGDVVSVKYTCYSVGDGENDNTNILLARSDKQKGVVGDGSMVPGWDEAIRSMNLNERAIIRVTDPALGYVNMEDSKDALEALGVSQHTQLEFDIQITKIQTAAEAAELFDMNFDSMALADDTPRTAEDIAAAYETKMAQKEPDREGWEGWLDTVQNYYFFGIFESETGEVAPWYLTPSISFPLAFSVVGAAFWISLASGAISEKGQQSIDELDMIVKTTTIFLSSSM